MKTDRRELTDLEKAECAALKAEIAARNARNDGSRKLTQEYLGQELGMTQGNLSSHLNGKRPISKEMAAKMAVLLDIPVERFSPRLAKEIAEMAEAVRPRAAADSVGEQAATYKPVAPGADDAAADGQLLETMAALHVIQMGLFTGQLTDEQVEQIMRIRNDIVHRPAKRATKASRLQGLLASAFKADENGGSPDDLLRMYQLGMEKEFAKEGAVDREQGKKPARRS